MKSHYLFDSHFCQVRRANEKGVVESRVKYARLHFLVPVPQVVDLEERNRRLLEQCIEDRQRRLRGQKGTKEVLLEEDRAELLFEVVSRAYERTRLRVTTHLPFEAWTEVLGSERRTGALPDRRTHRIHILEANGESDRLGESKRRLKQRASTRKRNQEGFDTRPLAGFNRRSVSHFLPATRRTFSPTFTATS